jgi:small subunit ribosomal protein S16
VAVKIRLKRMGKIHAPFYRVVVMDSRTKRDGRAIEEIGKYHPTHEPSVIEIDSERVQYWLGVGAQPTEQVAVLLKITGDWQKYKGLPGTEGTLRVGEPKADKKALFEVASKAAMSEPKSGATTARKSKVEKAEKAAEPKAEKADKADKAAEPKVEKAEKAAEPKVEKAEKAAEPKVEKADKTDKAAEPKVEKADQTDKAAEPKVEKAESPVADAPVVDAPVAEVAAASDEAKAEA